MFFGSVVLFGYKFKKKTEVLFVPESVFGSRDVASPRLTEGN